MNRAIAWFAENSVSANLLMFLILGGGLWTAMSLKQEIFPEFSSDLITVSVVYLGAAPEEVEEGVCIRIEEEIQSLEGIKRITSTAVEGVGVVTVELLPGVDTRKLLDDIKNRVDAIDTFPEETEKPVIQEVIVRRQVINVAILGNADEVTLKYLGERVRDEIAALPGITQVELSNARPYEISIEVSEDALQRYGLTFDEVVRAVRRSSLDLPGGSVKTSGGEILLRTKGQAYRGPEFDELVLRSFPDGTRLRLGDVAQVVDGFADTDQSARFDSKPSVMVQVFRVGEENALEIAEAIKDYVSQAQPRMPEGITLTIWQDFSRILRGRLDLLIRNGRAGLVLVFLSLALFLRLRLAFWVALGIPISFLGAIWLMPTFDVSINLISLFAFIAVLGIVVDDAIVIGENIYTHQQRGKKGLRAAVDGAQELAMPVIFAVMTTVAAFAPLLSVPGNMGKIMKFIPLIVIPTLLFSLVESLFILPAHLSHSRSKGHPDPSRGIRGIWGRFQEGFAGKLRRFIDTVYRPILELGLRWRYLTLAIGVSILLITFGLVGGGWIKFLFFPNVDAANVVALLTMPQGTPVEVTADAVRRLEESAQKLRKELEAEGGGIHHGVFRHVLASIGEHPFSASQSPPGQSTSSFSGAHLGEVNIELAPSEERSITSPEIASRWRNLTGPIPDAQELTFTSSLFSTGEAINIQLAVPDRFNRGLDYDQLKVVADELKRRLNNYSGVIDIRDSFRPGKQEVELSITPAAEALGLSLSDLARQVRQAFYGEEAQRIQRGRDDIRVMVRYPADGRRSLGDLENMRIRTPSGGEVPFSVAATAKLGRGYAAIQRTDRRRTVNVTADVDHSKANANEILADLTGSALPKLLADHPGISYSLEGEQREQSETLDGLKHGFGIALLMIYALLAVPFRSYIQPLIVMAAIPFGMVGAIWGHIIMGMDLTILSMFGIVALTGVVVSDSLIMVDFVNRTRADGTPIEKALRQAGVARFRPILLTSLTTFAGLTPLLLERSLQAQFLIPMAISLGFGVLFATFITLLLVPVGYFILEDLKHLGARLLGRQDEVEEEIEQVA